jgi:ATP-binding cassette, subfamily B, bacterial
MATSERWTPVSDEAAELDDAPAAAGFDPLAYLQSAVGEPKSASGLFSLIGRSVRMASRASPRVFWVNLTLSVGVAGLLGVQVLFGKLALASLLRQDHGGRVGAVIPPLVGLAAATALSGLMTSSQQLLQRLLGEEVQRQSWSGIVGVTTRVPLETFESPEFFDALQRVKTNALLRPVTLTQGLVQFVSGLLGVLGLTVVLFLIQPILVAVLLAGSAPLWLISREMGRAEFRFRAGQTPLLRLNEYLINTLCGRDEAKEIRAFELSSEIHRRWVDNYTRYLADYRAHIRRRLVLASANALVTTIVTSASLGLLVWLIVRGDVGLAAGGAALLAVRLLSGNMQQVFYGISELFESALFLRDHDAFLSRAPAPTEAEPAVHGTDRGPAPARAARRSSAPRFREISLRDVGFRYPGTAVWALQDVSLTLRAGESIALVGENGSGKTTLAKLLGLLFAPTKGEIRWAGVDVSTLDPSDLRPHIGLLFQDFVRYQLSAHENIAFGRPENQHDDDAVQGAARQSGAHAFLRALPHGYETGLGKEYHGGQDLSVGQWQRVALARAYFRDADLLVLDEPTASMDARSEHELFQHVRELAAGRALVLISHRFSTVRGVDRIYVMERGRIIERGSHEDLIAQDGRYAELFELQAAAYR